MFDPETVTVALAARGFISVAWLKCQDLHPDNLRKFTAEFGGGMWLTRANLVRLALTDFKLAWLVDRILAAPARKAYLRAVAPVNRRYLDDLGRAEDAWVVRQVATAEVLSNLLGLPEDDGGVGRCVGGEQCASTGLNPGPNFGPVRG